MPAPRFDRNALDIRPLSERDNDLDRSVLRDLDPSWAAGLGPFSGFDVVARALVEAKNKGRARVLMCGAHVLRAGVQRYLIDWMEQGLITGLALNGAGVIHDYEFALIGATTESVARYIKTGHFGMWRETGQINDVVREAYQVDPEVGLGAAVGRAIATGDFPYADTSVLAAGHRLGVPVTVHVSLGQDIIHQLPNCDGAATGALTYNDFLAYTAGLRDLEGGVVMNFGSAVMAPEIFLKALSMVRNEARQAGKTVGAFTTLVADLKDIPSAPTEVPPKTDPAYYFRPLKTMLLRTVADGGVGRYVKGDHVETLPALWSAVQSISEGVAPPLAEPAKAPVDANDGATLAAAGWRSAPTKVVTHDEMAQFVAAQRAQGRTVAYCHGCFDLMHPGHIQHFEEARAFADVLVVTISPDEYIDKGPGRPVFKAPLRLGSIAALGCVDRVALNQWPTAVESLKRLKPSFYVKGAEFETLEDATGKLHQEVATIEELGGEMRFTHGVVFSSSQLLKEYFQ